VTVVGCGLGCGMLEGGSGIDWNGQAAFFPTFGHTTRWRWRLTSAKPMNNNERSTSRNRRGKPKSGNSSSSGNRKRYAWSLVDKPVELPRNRDGNRVPRRRASPAVRSRETRILGYTRFMQLLSPGAFGSCDGAGLAACSAAARGSCTGQASSVHTVKVVPTRLP
jgi:hypothetical protein